MRIRDFSTAVSAVSLFLSATCANATEGEECPSVETSVDTALAAQIDPIVDGALERGFTGGVTVMRDGVMVYKRVAGSASRKKNIPVTEDTLFHVASIAKYFTATLVLKASEEGVVSLDDPVAKYAPESKIGKRRTTIFDLLAHRSGLGSSYAAEKVTDKYEALSAIDNAKFDESRLGAYHYSNDGYDLLGILLEIAYDRPYEDIIRENIFDPLCLERPRVWGTVDVADPNIVSQPLRTVSKKLRQRNYGLIGSGGFLITAADLTVYENALSDGLILNDASLSELRAPRGESSIGQVTFGAFLVTHPVLGVRVRAGGYEDWGDNAIMNHYLNRNIIVTVTTSRGPAEHTGEPPFRSEISEAIEAVLAKAETTAE
jgi:CubicO group peptidase (beta-lactamase class C family)